MFGNGGDDALNGNEGTDSLYVVTDNDITLSDTQATGDGTDTIYNLEQANLYGRSADNSIDARGATNIKAVIRGYDGNDTLRGGALNDNISGGNDDDILFGNAGNDVFAIEAASGEDRIKDFEDGSDLFGLTNSLGFSDLNITNNLAQTATLIRDTTNNNELLAIVENVSAVDITVDDFMTI